MIEQNSAEIEIKIGIVEAEKHLPNSLKDQRISELRFSLIQHNGQDSSFKVITSIANTMVGSSIIVYPIMFVKDGMLGSLIVLLVIGAVLFFTCRILLVHNKANENDFGQSIKRILGSRWAKFNSAVNITLLYIVSIAYFMLICSNFFDITAAILTQINSDYKQPTGKSLVFDKYSPQYACLICILFTSPLICKRDIQVLMSFFKFTIYFVLLYGIFVLVGFIKVLAQDRLNFMEYHLFNPDFSTVAGAFALSLLLHPVGAPILKRNINPKNNMRDLFLGYALTALIYVYIGFIGGLTCSPYVQDIYDSETDSSLGQYNTIFDCFKKNDSITFFIIGKIVQLGIFIQNLSVMPILSFLTRKEFLEQFQNEIWRKNAFYLYNISMIMCCLVITFFEVNVSIVLSLNGAIVGFFMAYAIPIATHLTCYHKKMSHQEKKQRTELLLSVETDNQTMDEALQCNDHPKRGLAMHLIIYGGILLMGVAVGIFKLYSLFE